MISLGLLTFQQRGVEDVAHWQNAEALPSISETATHTHTHTRDTDLYTKPSKLNARKYPAYDVWVRILRK